MHFKYNNNIITDANQCIVQGFNFKKAESNLKKIVACTLS